MSDDLNNRGEPDRSRIALGEEHEVRYWTGRFGISEEKLRSAVKEAGNSAEAVERWIAKHQ
ncbi:Protein of unknown function [Pseudoxanthomonas indica]|uniref:DUF3606 domain-containing protein n=2 Tax=Pseudoxanthomonas indica TaxID=428993 RepID=A0A1T5JAX0_9GAMM|nr:DUF3606 domain-containing protein [Pseudoxanthomonas indica]GGD57723.1 DUF3606 domain-containing protein [Pseudoxanthomonas indica]SKC48677.1 Protein of unknown function [Pseudoxanthomonas indica]